MKVWREPAAEKKSVQRWWLGVTMPLLLTACLFLAACEYPGIEHPLFAQAGGQVPAGGGARLPAPNPGASEPKAAQGPTDATAAQGNADAQAAGGPIDIGLKDFRLDPDQVTTKAGTITFVLKNEGRYTHDFRVEGQGIDEKAPKVGAGRTFEWQIDLKPGTYRISCPISNHADRGMTGALAVAP